MKTDGAVVIDGVRNLATAARQGSGDLKMCKLHKCVASAEQATKGLSCPSGLVSHFAACHAGGFDVDTKRENECVLQAKTRREASEVRQGWVMDVSPDVNGGLVVKGHSVLLYPHVHFLLIPSLACMA